MSKYHSSSFKNSAMYAIHGLRIAFRSQPNVHKHLRIFAVMLVIAVLLQFKLIHYAIFILSSFSVIVAELFNSAIEFTLDAYYKNKFSNMVKMAKDISAGAVLLAACVNVAVFGILALDKIF